jgi:hypothetical protein
MSHPYTFVRFRFITLITRDAMAFPNSTSKNHTILIPFIVNLVLFVILFAGFYFLPLPQLLQCTYPLAENSILAICIAFVVQYFAFKSYQLFGYFWIAGMDIGLILLALWLGSYSISPLGFSSGRIPLAQGFVVTRSMRPDVNIASGKTINIVSGSVIAIRTVTLPIGKNCFWFSSKHGSFDDPRSCDVAYMPPTNSDFDLLKVLIQPSCRLPEVQESLKIIVLP